MNQEELERMKEASASIARSFSRLSRLVLIEAPDFLIEKERRILLGRVEAFPCSEEVKAHVDQHVDAPEDPSEDPDL